MKQSEIVAAKNAIRFPQGLGCSFHDNCFTCPLPNPDKCHWNSDNTKSHYIVVDPETHRKLVFGDD
jgi:hypothetical protein